MEFFRLLKNSLFSSLSEETNCSQKNQKETKKPKPKSNQPTNQQTTLKKHPNKSGSVNFHTTLLFKCHFHILIMPNYSTKGQVTLGLNCLAKRRYLLISSTEYTRSIESSILECKSTIRLAIA